MRKSTIKRKTKETDITVSINLDGKGIYNINTPIPFLNHMLEQLSKHSFVDIDIEAKGDVEIDFHHTCEDVAIVLGEAFNKALGDRAGINRFASAHIPMDDVLTLVAIDLSGRPYSNFAVEFSIDKLGEFDTELFREWFNAFAQTLKANIHVKNLYGKNNHHKIESCFKGLAICIASAIKIDEGKKDIIRSTKGSIT